MNPRRILVVDDEKNQRDILQIILTGERDKEGGPLYDVTTANSAPQDAWNGRHPVAQRAVSDR
jgi:CheY-like chemotaxis protein